MKFTVSRDVLLDSLNLVQATVERKTTVPVLGSVLLSARDGSLFVAATDLEVGIRASCACEVLEAGEAAIPGKRFVEAVRELPAGSVLEISARANGWVDLRFGEVSLSLLALPAKEFPISSLPLSGEAGAEAGFRSANASVLCRLLDQTLFVVSTDHALFHLHGVLLEPRENGMLRLVGTDMYRLAYAEAEVFLERMPLQRGTILPKKGAQELRRVLERAGEGTAQIAFERGYLLARIPGIQLAVRLMEGEFIDYARILPEERGQVAKVGREAALAAVRQVNVFADERSRAVKMRLEPGAWILKTSNPEAGEARSRMPLEYRGEAIEVGFNSRYLLEGLSHMAEGARVEIEVRNRLKPVLLREEGRSGHAYVLMPTRA